MKIKMALCLVPMILAVVSPAHAEPTRNTYGLDLGAGLNTLTPYGNVRFHYCPEMTGNFTWNASFQVGPAFSKTGNPDTNFIGIMGSRYYVHNQGWFQPYLSGSIGISSEGGFIALQPVPGIFGLLGVGSDFMMTDAFGLSFEINSDLVFLSPNVMAGTLALRPEVNLKWKW